MQVDEREGGLGFVGYLTEVNLDFLRSLWRAGVVPVASCLGLGADGELYNINADHMAAAAAEFIRADRLIFLTDVAGVLDGEKVLRAVRGGEIEDLIRQQQSFGRHDFETRSGQARLCREASPKCASSAEHCPGRCLPPPTARAAPVRACCPSCTRRAKAPHAVAC